MWYFWSKIAFLEVFFGFGGKINVSIGPFLFCKNWNHPPKIQILTNVKTSPLQEKIKIYDDVFVRIQKCILKGVFVFVSNGFFVICKYILAIKLCFFIAFLTLLDASDHENKVTFKIYFLKVGISCELWF